MAVQHRASTRQVRDILQRMQDESLQPQALKTCTGLLTILAREDHNKLVIVEAGIPIVLQAMQRWLDNRELQESGCDLIWTLAFDNNAAKQALCMCGGMAVLGAVIQQLGSHAEVMKSACGALSNLAQFKHCKKLTSVEAVVAPMTNAIRMYQRDAVLLPFILDAFASVVIGDEKSAKFAVAQSVILSILGAITRNKSDDEVARSGCHALAILAEFSGHAVLVAAAGGVPVILTLLATHPQHTELHRVAVVMLFRVLQDTSTVFRDILVNDGVRILLQSLSHHRAQKDIAIPTLHILHTLLVHQKLSPCMASEQFEQQLFDTSKSQQNVQAPNSSCRLIAVLELLAMNTRDKEVVRIACCLLQAAMHWAVVIAPLHTHSVLEILARCAFGNPDLRSVTDCATELLRSTDRFAEVPPFSMRFLVRAMQGMSQCIAARRDDPHVLWLGFKVLLDSFNQTGASEVLQEAASSNFDWGKAVLDACLLCITYRPEARPHQRMTLQNATTFTEAFLDRFTPRWETDQYADAKRVLDARRQHSSGSLEAASASASTTTSCDGVEQPTDNHHDKSSPITDTAANAHSADENIPPSTNGLSQNDGTPSDCFSRLPTSPSLAAHGMCSKHPALTLLQTSPTSLEGLLPPSPPTSLLQHTRDIGTGVVVFEERPVPGMQTTAALQAAPNTASSFHTRLKFDSAFESGNLHRAVQRGMFEYDLFLRNDLNTTGHTQWFFFAVGDTHRGISSDMTEPVEIKFNIVNLTKPDSLFSRGMQPVMYSCAAAERDAQGWVRAGKNISYRPNVGSALDLRDSKQSYTLSFTLQFLDASDTYLIAHSYPYTYTDLKNHIGELLAPHESPEYVRHAKLCSTIGGNDCDILVFTDFRQSGSTVSSTAATAPSSVWKQLDRKSKQTKPSVVITSRVHPGEAPASWMMKGVMDFLSGQSPQAKLIRDQLIVCTIPMLNPDGVIVGNNRCSLAGVDLNRCWKKPSKTMHPTIFSTKRLLKSLHQSGSGNVALYLDLHGHSRKFNIFLYGCEDQSTSTNNNDIRLLPRMLSTHPTGSQFFSYKDCSFAVTRGREATARVVVARDVGIPSSYTVESSFCGADFDQAPHHFTAAHYQEAGRALCESILEFAQTCRLVTTLPPAVSALAAPPTSGDGADTAVGDDVCSESSDEPDTAQDEQSTAMLSARTAPMREMEPTKLILMKQQVGRPSKARTPSSDALSARVYGKSLMECSQQNGFRASHFKASKPPTTTHSRQNLDQRSLVVRRRLVRSYTTPAPAASFGPPTKQKQG